MAKTEVIRRVRLDKRNERDRARRRAEISTEIIAH